MAAWLAAISADDGRGSGDFPDDGARLAPHWDERVVDPKEKDGRPWGSAGWKTSRSSF